ncbi:uncharacterized protein LOC133925935 [Phragmites australis]|uniref:uncharacterized protein LOC133925935 n=1 Tax=Phragmites australis TaxID=29695 RepID=UPI002D79EE2C|nr:uncharacterized protein LOC133925935 [Phragmites australis]
MQSPAEAPEPAAVSEAATAVAPEPVPEGEAAAAEVPQQGAETSAPADGRVKSPSPGPASPSTEKERQIPVDPASLRRLGMVADEDSPLSAPSVLTEVVVQSPLLPQLRRPTFVGASLPCSAASSPVQGTGPGAGAKWEEPPATPSPTAALRSLARQHSAALARLVATPALAPPALSRSASRAQGRTMAPHDDDDDEPTEPKPLGVGDGFTCGALCMLIPVFSKKKPAAAATAAGMAVSNMQRQQSGLRPRRSSVSRVVSLERFECGSWSPPPPAPAQHDSDCLALEVAKISWADDAEAPVKMAFVFDGETPMRGILKNSASSRLDSARPSSSSQRHVRFSTAAAGVVSCPSSPSSAGTITPRMARARAEFNAFLEAQSA